MEYNSSQFGQGKEPGIPRQIVLPVVKRDKCRAFHFQGNGDVKDVGATAANAGGMALGKCLRHHKSG